MSDEKLNKQNTVTTVNVIAPTPEQQLLQRAFELHQQNKLQEAEALYREILATNPRQPEALYLLGIIALQFGHHAIAEELILHSLNINPNNIDAHLNLGNAYQAQKKFAQAEQSFQNALHLNTNIPEIWFNLGNLFDAQGKHEKAAESFNEAISLRPNWEPPYIHLGLSLKSLSRDNEAIQAFRKALELNPESYETIHNMANLLDKMGQTEEANIYYQKIYDIALAREPSAENYSVLGIACGALGDWEKALEYQKKVVALEPKNVKAWGNLANAYRHLNMPIEAEKLYHHAIVLEPTYAEAYFNLGCFYHERMLFEDAAAFFLKTTELNPRFNSAFINLGLVYSGLDKSGLALESIQKAIALDSEDAQAHAALGDVIKSRGRIAEAIQHYKKAILLKPDYPLAHSNYIFTMHYDTSITSQEIYEETIEWGDRHANSIPKLIHSNNPDPARRLRIGYVSGDLRHHAVVQYLEPVLQSHDKSQVEIFCYANQARGDDVTTRLKSYADHWRDIFRLSDKAAADLIQKDKIDILIDLSGHTSGNRLQVFARKPAPIQATWIGYFNTTGVKAIDYIITDRFLLPPEEEHLYVEKPLRLTHHCVALGAHNLPITVNELPALTNGYVTFGCFNALSKLVPVVLNLWAEILKKIPTSRLYLKNGSFGDEAIREQYKKKFADLGVPRERLIFVGPSSMADYLAEYNKVDFALDPFPYNGATTTLDGLWMGIPPVTLKGDRLAAHMGESWLTAVGLEDFIARNQEEYIEKTVAFANDLPRLALIRRKLRPTLTSIPLTDPMLITRDLEAALRYIWKQWCQRQ